jgi:hypothetical protein
LLTTLKTKTIYRLHRYNLKKHLSHVLVGSSAEVLVGAACAAWSLRAQSSHEVPCVIWAAAWCGMAYMFQNKLKIDLELGNKPWRKKMIDLTC